MKIYQLQVSELAECSILTMTSSSRAERYPRNWQYFKTRELAEKRQKEIYDGAQMLLGFIPKIDAVIYEIEVTEE